jgi:hypothetical protein
MRIVEGEPGSLPWPQWGLWMWLRRRLNRTRAAGSPSNGQPQPPSQEDTPPSAT